MNFVPAALLLLFLDAHMVESNQVFQLSAAQEDNLNAGKEELEALQNNPTVSEVHNIAILPIAYTFKVYNNGTDADDTQPTMSDELDEVVASCLVSAYNIFHDPSKHKLLAQEIDSKEIYNIPAMGETSESSDNLSTWSIPPHWLAYNVFLFGWRGNSVFVNCNMCDPNVLDEGESESTELSSPPGETDPQWEENFCSCLVEDGEKEPAFDILTTAYDCRIQRNDVPPTLKDAAKLESEHQAKITFTLQFDHIIEEEQKFITTTLEDVIDSSKYVSESSAIVYSPTIDMMPGTSQVKYHDDQKRGTSFLRQTDVAGLNTNIQQEYVFSIFATIVSSTNLAVSLQNIDGTFCSLLASGPFPRLESISDCNVEEVVPSDETTNH